LIGPDVGHRDDIRMAERGCGAGFLKQKVAVADNDIGTCQDFDGDDAVQSRITSPIDCPYPPGADRAKDLVVADRIPGRWGHLMSIILPPFLGHGSLVCFFCFLKTRGIAKILKRKPRREERLPYD